MGFLKNIAKKISNAVASLKASGSAKALAKADLNLSNSTIVNNSVLTGRDNFDEKLDSFKDASTKHFLTYFKGKSLKEVADYVTDLTNFVHGSEFVRQIDAKNRQRAMHGDKSKLSIKDLKQYFAGGQNLSEKDREAYRQIASRTQAKARALSYIKANFVGICNMRDLSSSDDKENFTRIMDAIKSYADKDINNFAVSDFDSEKINSKVLKSRNDYLKALNLSESNVTKLLQERMDANLEAGKLLKVVAKTLNDYSNEFDKKINTIITKNHEIEQKQIINNSFALLNKNLRTAHDEYEKKLETSKLDKIWVKNSKLKRKEKKAILARQQEFVSAFTNIARDVPLYENDEDGNVRVFGNDYNIFNIVNGDDNLEKLLNLIESYNQDDSVDHSNDIFVVKSDENQTVICTKTQDSIMKKIYNDIVEYAKDTVSQPDYQGENPLENFCYKNLRHSISEETLTGISSALLGDGFDKNSIATDYQDLTPAQIESLYNFIADNEPVKTLLSNSEASDFEVDNQLLSTLSPDNKNSSLDTIIAHMQIKGIESEIDRMGKEFKENASVVESNKSSRDKDFAEAQNIYEEMTKTLDNIANVGDMNYAQKNKNAVNVETIKNIIDKDLAKIVGQIELPENAEQLGNDLSSACTFGNVRYKMDKTYAKTIPVKNGQNAFYLTSALADNLLEEIENDIKDCPTSTIDEKDSMCKKYLTIYDKENIKEFTNEVKSTIKHKNVLTTADNGLEERDF